MYPSIVVIIGSLICASALTIACEKSAPNSGHWMGIAALIAMYGVCVGCVSALLGYFFDLRTIVSLAIAIPLGVPALFVVAKLAD